MLRLISLLSIGIFFCLFTSPCQAGVVDRSVAVVNNEIITLSEVNDLGKPLFQKIMAEVPPEHRDQELAKARKQIIDKLVEKILILQEAQKLGVQVREQEVDQSVQQILAQNKTSMQQFRKELSKVGLTPKQYRDDLRDQLLTRKVFYHAVRSKIIITDDMLIDYYDTKYTDRVEEGGYYLLQIGCTWGSKDANGNVLSEEKAKKKIEKLHALAMKGSDFNTLAKKYSDLPSATDGGDLGTFQKDEMAAYMRDAVVDLQPGQISSIVANEHGFQFFKLVSKQKGQIIPKKPFKEVKEEIRQKIQEQAMLKHFEEWMQSLRKQAYIKIM